MSAKLQGQVILNTRPLHQQAELTALLKSAGAQVLSFPVIAISIAAANAETRALGQNLPGYDILIFVSRNAVDAAFHFIGSNALTSHLQFGVIGAATASALVAQLGITPERIIAPAPYNSESLLAAEELQAVAGKRILIFRGQRGRNLLGGTLSDRGAEVDYCEVYRRELPAVDSVSFRQLVAVKFPTLVILTSNEGMHNLFELVDTAAAQRLRHTPWLLISERMRESALKLGHNAALIVAQSASDSGIQQTICDWADQNLAPV